MAGILCLIGLPIGNTEDITKRALNTLNCADLILCEEFKFGKKFLKDFSIERPLDILNEHNEREKAPEIIKFLLEGKQIALISDHGTPLIEDPGNYLVQQAIKNNIKVTSIPGASSILSGLILSGFDLKKFFYAGLLSQKNDIRKKELNNLKTFPATLVFLDVPYRLHSLLKSIEEAFGTGRKACLLIDLTLDSEKIIRGTLKEILNRVISENIKKVEFVLVVEGYKK